jgi:hypothetical protein
MSRTRLMNLAALAAAIMLGSAAPSAAGSADQTKSAARFEAQMAEQGTAEAFFGGGGGEPVTFDVEAARERGISSEGIALAEELAAYTNDLVSAMAAAGIADVTQVKVEVEQYPRVLSYMNDATRYIGAIEEQAGRTDLALPICTVFPRSPACICGQIGNPRPPRAVQAQQVWSANPTLLLSSLGYHPTRGYASPTPSWSRWQTWRADKCRNNAFRDHAWAPHRNYHLEQNYWGISPRGEPNPEVLNYSPWPYPAWPAYVRWWHDRY